MKYLKNLISEKSIIIAFAGLLMLSVSANPPITLHPGRPLKSGARDTAYIDKSVIINGKEEQSNGFDWQRNMPWIGAILIGVLTIAGNLYVNDLMRKHNRDIAQKQIDSAKQVALEQLTVLQNNNIRDFNKTVLSASRQSWINSFRDIVTDLLSQGASFIIKNGLDRTESRNLQSQCFKAELMLNETEHKALIDELISLRDTSHQVEVGNKPNSDLEPLLDSITNLSKKIIQEEWNRARLGI